MYDHFKRQTELKTQAQDVEGAKKEAEMQERARRLATGFRDWLSAKMQNLKDVRDGSDNSTSSIEQLDALYTTTMQKILDSRDWETQIAKMRVNDNTGKPIPSASDNRFRGVHEGKSRWGFDDYQGWYGASDKEKTRAKATYYTKLHLEQEAQQAQGSQNPS